MNAQKVLTLPDSKKVLLGGVEHEIRPLYFKQMLRLTKFIGGYQSVLMEKIKPGISNAGFVMALLEIADDKLPELLSLLIGKSISAEDSEKITLDEFSKLALGLMELNDFQGIKEVFMAAAAWAKAMALPPK